MENSEKYRTTIELGRKIAKDLGTTSRTDFLAGWMAHYIAELIERYENAIGTAKEELGDKIFETVLRLWNHRYQSSSGFDPIKRCKPILETLSRLDPKEERPFYSFNHPEKTDENGEDLKALSEIALGVDRTARKLLQALLVAMTIKGTDQNMSDYINLVMPEHLTDDLNAVRELMTDVGSEDFPQRFENLLQQVHDFGLLCINFGSVTNVRPDIK